jgi:hypothetical protein
MESRITVGVGKFEEVVTVKGGDVLFEPFVLQAVKVTVQIQVLSMDSN